MAIQFLPIRLSKYIIILLSLLGVQPVVAQNLNAEIDSMLHVIETHQQTSETDTILARFYLDLGKLYDYNEEYEKALDCYDKCLDVSKDNIWYRAVAYFCRAASYHMLGRHTVATKDYGDALRLAMKTDDKRLIGKIYYNLSVMYSDLGRSDLEGVYLLKSYDYIKDISDLSYRVIFKTSMADYYRSIDDSEKAKEFVESAVKDAEELGSIKFLSYAYSAMGIYYLSVKDTLKCLEYTKRAFELDQQSGNMYECAITSMNIAKVYSKLDERDSVLLYLSKVKGYVDKSNRPFFQAEKYKEIFIYYQQIGIYDSLKDVFIDYARIADSLMNIDKLSEYTEAKNEMQLLIAQQENTILQLKEEESRQQLMFSLVISAGLMASMVVVIFIGRKYKRQKERVEELNRQTVKQTKMIEHQNKILKQNAKYKDRVMSLLAHDLRTPFASIQSLNYLIRATGSLNNKQLEYIDTSNKIIEGGLNLISDILHVYKLESITDHDFDPINITALLKDSVKRIEPIAIANNQKITLDVEDNVEFITNREMLQSAIDNLLSNALKYSPQGKDVTIFMRKKDKKLVIKVIDNGLGFAKDELKVIFDRFNSFSRKVLRKETSTGLGLFLVKGFVTKLGGEITVDSKLNEGTTFTLTFEEKVNHKPSNKQNG